MPIQELDRGKVSTSNQSAEIPLSGSFQRESLVSDVGKNSELAGTGFNLFLEINRLVKNYNQNLAANKDHLTALIPAASELEINIRTFVVEYIQSNTILPHVNRLEELDGRIRMVGQNGVPVVLGITGAERYGATLTASERVENWLTAGGLKKVPDQVAVINSPLGHSGLINEKGLAVSYKTNQTMVFWTDAKADLHGLTIVSDLNPEQSKRLSIALGINEDILVSGAEDQEIANIVANPALFSYGRSITSPAKYVLEKILAIRGNSDIRLEQADGSVEYRSVTQTFQDIKRFESLLKFNDLWEEVLKNLRRTVICQGAHLDQAEAQSVIAKAVEEAILKITTDYLQQSGRIDSYPTTITDNKFNSQYAVLSYSRYSDTQLDTDNRMKAVFFLRTRGGCNGGGGSSSGSLRGVSLGAGDSISSGSSLESDQYGSLEFNCPKCGKTNHRPRGQLIPTCQHCRKSVKC